MSLPTPFTEVHVALIQIEAAKLRFIVANTTAALNQKIGELQETDAQSSFNVREIKRSIGIAVFPALKEINDALSARLPIQGMSKAIEAKLEEISVLNYAEGAAVTCSLNFSKPKHLKLS